KQESRSPLCSEGYEEPLISARMVEDIWPLKNVRLGESLGHSNDKRVYELISDKKRFVIKMTGQYSNEADFERSVMVFDFLGSNCFKYIPKLLKTRSSDLYARRRGAFAYLLDYIEGTTPEDNQETWKQLGGVVGELHSFVNYPFTRTWNFESEMPNFMAIAR